MKPTSRPRLKAKVRPKTTFKIEGQAALMEFARYKPQAIVSIAAAHDVAKNLQVELNKLGVDVPIQALPKATPGTSKEQQGRVSPVRAEVKVMMHDETDLMNWIESEKPSLILALDHITDPRNLGAIVRSAAFYGIKKVIVPERRQVLLTDASVATAQGGFALCDLVCVVNLGRILEQLKKRDFWILGAAMNGDAIEGVVGTYEQQVLVLGAEDKGLSHGVEQKCDRLVALVGGGGNPGGLDSLNVAVAAGIFLHSLTR